LENRLNNLELLISLSEKMKRFIESYLALWKNNSYHKSLIICKTRQVVKTYTVDKSGKENFEYFLKVNIKQDENIKMIFNVKTQQLAISELTIFYHIPIQRKALLFIDDIQMVREAIAALCYFDEQIPEAVKVYIESKNLAEVENTQSVILTPLQYEFAKYSSHKKQECLKECIKCAENNVGKKVKYTAINKNASSKLELNHVIHLVRKAKLLKVPTNQCADNNVFRPGFLVVGLVYNLAKIKFTCKNSVIADFVRVLKQFAGQKLIASFGFYEDTKLHYWTREAKNANIEMYFLCQIENCIYHVEVKAGKIGILKSFQGYLGEKQGNTEIHLNTNMPSVKRGLSAFVSLKNQKQNLSYDLILLPNIYCIRFQKNNGFLTKTKLIWNFIIL